MKKLFTILCFLILHATQAQTGSGSFSFRYDATATVTVAGKTLPNPWAGGLNSAQYSTMHLDADTMQDLVLFDRQTGRVLTFLAEKGEAGCQWRHAPQYESRFPAIEYWMLLVDYDRDGKKDLFTHTGAGIRVFHNVTANNQLAWELATDQLNYINPGSTSIINLYVASTDIPAITDVDDDGDIDIMTFGLGKSLEFYQNQSVEAGTPPGNFDFKKMSICWGKFLAGDNCNEFVFNYNCDDITASVPRTRSSARVDHNGNSMLVLDLNGDNKKDLLFGHVVCTNLARLNNVGGNGVDTQFASSENEYPAKNPVDFSIFPAPYYEDLDFDGVKDLVASPNTYGGDENEVDYGASNWMYHNAGKGNAPDFQLVSKRFLQEGMLDFSANTAPALADLDGDGDLDLLVGNAGTHDSLTYRASIAHFENVGTATKPAFELRTTDYLGLSQRFTLTGLKPTFADLDGNGTLDFIFTGNSATNTPQIRYILNRGARGAAFQLDPTTIQQLTNPDRLAPVDAVTWYDVDGDGKIDALIAKPGNTTEYHRNTGSATSPKYTLQQQDYGQLAGQFNGYYPMSVVIKDLNSDGRPEMLVSTRDGLMKLYQLPTSPTGKAVLLDSTLIVNAFNQGVNTITIQPEKLGGYLMLAAGDLNGDQLPEILVGTSAGGVRYLLNTSEKGVITGNEEEIVQPWVYPNPTERYVVIKAPANGTVDLVNLVGQPVTKPVVAKAQTEMTVDLGALPVGVYLVRFMQEGQSARVQRIVVWK